jgi:hypothetical protein
MTSKEAKQALQAKAKAKASKQQPHGGEICGFVDNGVMEWSG